jgi:hypothetical protein
VFAANTGTDAQSTQAVSNVQNLFANLSFFTVSTHRIQIDRFDRGIGLMTRSITCAEPNSAPEQSAVVLLSRDASHMRRAKLGRLRDDELQIPIAQDGVDRESVDETQTVEFDSQASVGSSASPLLERRVPPQLAATPRRASLDSLGRAEAGRPSAPISG